MRFECSHCCEWWLIRFLSRFWKWLCLECWLGLSRGDWLPVCIVAITSGRAYHVSNNIIWDRLCWVIIFCFGPWKGDFLNAVFLCFVTFSLSREGHGPWWGWWRPESGCPSFLTLCRIGGHFFRWDIFYSVVCRECEAVDYVWFRHFSLFCITLWLTNIRELVADSETREHHLPHPVTIDYRVMLNKNELNSPTRFFYDDDYRKNIGHSTWDPNKKDFWGDFRFHIGSD